ncbi:clostripain-related cysteine peptidase [Capnocytophaga sp.]|uniref:clostripain-related cysteine peptidase n=1 Tax=Capnocytophaga sp. TaxID=44737 RepID=UPI0026DCB53C|nr:clostripain-related cysteine peptidase [Capnocytophaga sp.]MDO5105502.1 clostripain-related cysteine peptidase [Capnocytophaga sp.]
MENNKMLKPLVIVLLQVVLLVSCNKSEYTQTELLPKSNAVFIYMIADNDLDFYATANINEMEAFAAQNPNAGSVYVYIDRAKNRKTAHPVLYQISADTTAKINSKILKVYPENNSANEQIFKNVLDEVFAITITKNEKLRRLVLWSHGSAWLLHSSLLTSNRATAVKSFGLDQTNMDGGSFHSEMDIRKLASSLKGCHFDFLLFDACFMASIEVFYELKNNFDYIIASPTEVLASGFPYKEILGDMLAQQVNYKNISQKYVSHFQQKKGILQSASAVVIKTDELDNFAKELKKYVSDSKEINTANWLQYDQGNAGYLFDMGDFITHLQENQADNKLLDQFEKMRVAYHHTPYFFNTIPLAKSSGISVFIPKKTTKKEEYDFYKTFSWSSIVTMLTLAK